MEIMTIINNKNVAERKQKNIIIHIIDQVVNFIIPIVCRYKVQLICNFS